MDTKYIGVLARYALSKLVIVVSMILPVFFYCIAILKQKRIFLYGFPWVSDHSTAVILALLLLSVYWIFCCPLKKHVIQKIGRQQSLGAFVIYNALPLTPFVYLKTLQFRPILAIIALVIVYAAFLYLSNRISEKHRARDRRIVFQLMSVLLILCMLIEAPICMIAERQQAKDMLFWSGVYDEIGKRQIEEMKSAANKTKEEVEDAYKSAFLETGLRPWMLLSNEEKLSCLGKISALESERLGIDASNLKITVAQLQEGMRGAYNHCEHTISLSSDLLIDPNPETAVFVLLHELRHRYQHICVDKMKECDAAANLELFDEVRIWQMNMANYLDGTRSYEAYRAQPLEDDANAWAAQRWAALQSLKNG